MKGNSTFQAVGFVCLKNKMRTCKAAFIKALEWKNATGAGLLAEGNDKSVSGKEFLSCRRFCYDL